MFAFLLLLSVEDILLGLDATVKSPKSLYENANCICPEQTVQGCMSV